MADKIEIFDSKQAEESLRRLSELLGVLDKDLLNLSKRAKEAGIDLSKIKTPDDLEAKIQKQTEAQQKARIAEIKLEQDREKAMDKFERDLEKTRIAELKLAAERDKRVAKGLANDAKEAAALEKKQSTYNKLNAALTKLKLAYRDLQVKQELGQKLTMKEEIRLKSLTEKVQRLDGVLKKTDAGMGVHTRSVGNYGKAFDSLGFSVAQMTRESPAFLISMNTGFMALSNNIPIFVDEVNKLVVANKALASQGKATKSVIGAIGRALFSWQSLISAGIVLLTLYGGKMIEYVGSLIDGAKGLNILKETQESVNEVKKEGIKQAGSELAQLKIYSQAVKDVSKTEDERNIILQKIRDKYGEDIKHLTDRQILTNGLADAEELLKNKIIERATADAAASKISENISKIIELQIARVKVIDEVVASQKRLTEAQKVQNTSTTQYGASIDNTAQSQRDFNNANDRLVQNSKDLNLLFSKNNELMKFAVKGIGLSTNARKEHNKEIEKEIRLRAELLEGFKSGLGDLTGSLTWMDEAIAQVDLFYKTAVDPKDREHLAQRKKDLLEMKAAMEAIADIPELKLSLEQDKITTSGFENIVADVVDFTDKYGEQIGQAIDATNMFFDNRIERLQQDRDANEEYYDTLINAASNNQEEQDALEREKEAKDKVLREKQNAVAKKQAIMNRSFAVFNILLNTAQAIIAALAPPPTGLGPVAGIPLSIATGAAGLAQSAAVAAAPLPQFAEGGVMDKDGLMMINDHSSGRQEFIERDGKIFTTTTKNAIIQGQKDDIIHKDINSLMDSNLTNDDIYKATVLASLRNGDKYNNLRIEKVLDNALKDLDKKITKGVRGAFSNVNMNTNVNVDLGWSKYKNNRL